MRIPFQKKEEEAREKRFGSRLDRKITFDFAGRQIIDDDDSAALKVRSLILGATVTQR